MATERCWEEEPEAHYKNGLRSYCHYADDIDTELRPYADDPGTWNKTTAATDGGVEE